MHRVINTLVTPDYIPGLWELNGVPVQRHIQFKLTMVVYCIAKGPLYLSDECTASSAGVAYGSSSYLHISYTFTCCVTGQN